MATKQQINLFKEGIANDLVDALIRVAPVDKGLLRQSIKSVPTSNGICISMINYALYVEFGTPPHIIKPKNKKALHWKNGAKDIFAKIVHHPGTRAQPFIRNTLRTKLGSIIKENAVRYLT